MTHLSYEEWQKYVKNELTSDCREKAEDHLYSCDHCLGLYIQAVAELEICLPDQRQMEVITDRVLMEIQEQNLAQELQQDQQQKPDQHLKSNQKSEINVPHKQQQKVLPFYQTAIFHYTLAAVATIVLMMTGVFHNITQYTESVQSPTYQKNHSSVTEGIVNRTFTWLDTFETKHKEAKSR